MWDPGENPGKEKHFASFTIFFSHVCGLIFFSQCEFLDVDYYTIIPWDVNILTLTEVGWGVLLYYLCNFFVISPESWLQFVTTLDWLSFMTLKLLIQYFVKLPLVWASWMHLSKNATEMILCPPIHCINGLMTSTCLITSDVNFDHLAKVVAARFLHYKSTIFSFAVKKISWAGAGERVGNTLRLCKYSFLLKLWPNFGIHHRVLSDLFIIVVFA